MENQITRQQPGSIPFGEDWARFARRQNAARRLAFFDTFLKMAEGWTPDANATTEELDDYDRMDRLISSHINGKAGGRPKNNTKETPSETPSKTPSETPSKTTPKSEKKEKKEKKERIEGNATARPRGKTPPTLDQFIEGGNLAGVPAEFAREFYAELQGNGGEAKDGRPIGNWRMYLRTAYADSQKKMRGACGRDELAQTGQLDSNLDLEGI